MTTKRNQHTREFKLEAISLVVDHKRKVVEVAESLGVGVSTLDNWVRKYKKERQDIGPTEGLALTDDQRCIQELEREVRQLKMEKDILKKASALLASDSLNVYR
ncbi:transposase [Psychrobacter piscatorii]|uniref:transposase n=1 Tax=Psychrobacter piscatorii TaxID=554343 RepID=UPI003735D45A